MFSIKEYFKEEGLKEGFARGLKQGTEQGIKKGIEQVALSMLKDGESIEKIAHYTGLPEEKILSLCKRFIGK